MRNRFKKKNNNNNNRINNKEMKCWDKYLI